MRHAPETEHQDTSSLLRDAILVGSVVLAASLFGILTRPLDFLAAFWPANPLLLGLLIRYPRLAKPSGWAAATAGYLAADLLTGNQLLITLWLTASNLAGVAVGYLLFQQLDKEDRQLKRPSSVLYLFAICSMAALASALVGGGLAPNLLGERPLIGILFWFITELAHSIIVLPVMLTALRPVASWQWFFLDPRKTSFKARQLTPVLALLISTLAAILIGGPGAIAFPAPALLWCALSYRMFTSVLLTLLVSICQLMSVSTGALAGTAPDNFIAASMSIRLGIALMALAPLTVASINNARNELLKTLDHAANHDALTGTLMRRAFLSRGDKLFCKAANGQQPLAVLMLDLDHFKAINDRHGHATGDQALELFANSITRNLRGEDLFGRLGGEEFGVVMPTATHEEAMRIAERLRAEVATQRIYLQGGETLVMTVSIGVASLGQEPAESLGKLLAQADAALYQAKLAGRNQVAVSRQGA